MHMTLLVSTILGANLVAHNKVMFGVMISVSYWKSCKFFFFHVSNVLCSVVFIYPSLKSHKINILLVILISCEDPQLLFLGVGHL